MGYTHYWGFKQNPKDIKNGSEKFKQSVELLKKCLANVPFNLASSNGKGEPTFGNTMVSFNGVGTDAHERFIIRLNDNNYENDFCKTARKPYDAAVCLALLCFKKYFKEDFSYTSDGNTNDEGWALADTIFTKYNKK